MQANALRLGMRTSPLRGASHSWLLGQRAGILDARASAREEIVDLAGQEEHGHDQQDRDRGDDEGLLGQALGLFTIAKGRDRRPGPNHRPQKGLAHSGSLHSEVVDAGASRRYRAFQVGRGPSCLDSSFEPLRFRRSENQPRLPELK